MSAVHACPEIVKVACANAQRLKQCVIAPVTPLRVCAFAATAGNASGALRIAKAYSVLECGDTLVPEVVVGQAQGGFAMGVGFVLLESLPPYEGGPGNGKWNLGQYVIARGSDLPLHDLEVEVLSPIDSDERPKGMAEIVMIPVAPALLNAIYDATGHRFRSLPVTQAMIKGVLT